MPPATLPIPSHTEGPSLSDYRNYFAILAAVNLGCLSVEEGRRYLGLPPGTSLEEVDFTRLNGYEDLSPYQSYRADD